MCRPQGHRTHRTLRGTSHWVMWTFRWVSLRRRHCWKSNCTAGTKYKPLKFIKDNVISACRHVNFVNTVVLVHFRLLPYYSQNGESLGFDGKVVPGEGGLDQEIDQFLREQRLEDLHRKIQVPFLLPAFTWSFSSFLFGPCTAYTCYESVTAISNILYHFELFWTTRNWSFSSRKRENFQTNIEAKPIDVCKKHLLWFNRADENPIKNVTPSNTSMLDGRCFQWDSNGSEAHELEDVDPDIRPGSHWLWGHDFVRLALSRALRPPSPPPVYDKGGNRLNTRDVRIRTGPDHTWNHLEPVWCQESHDSRVQQTDQVRLKCCEEFSRSPFVAMRYMIKHVDGYLPPVDWKPSKLMKKIIIPIDACLQMQMFSKAVFVKCRLQKTGRAAVFLVFLLLFYFQVWLLFEYAEESNSGKVSPGSIVDSDSAYQTSPNTVVLTQNISCSYPVRHLSWVSLSVLVVSTTKGFRTSKLLPVASSKSENVKWEDTTGCKIFIRGRDIGALQNQKDAAKHRVSECFRWQMADWRGSSNATACLPLTVISLLPWHGSSWLAYFDSGTHWGRDGGLRHITNQTEHWMLQKLFTVQCFSLKGQPSHSRNTYQYYPVL